MEEDLRDVELFEEHLSKLDSVCNWVVWWLRDQNRVDLWTGLKSFEHMLIDMLHAFPVFDDSVLHRVRQLQESPVFFLISKSRISDSSMKLTAAFPMNISFSYALKPAPGTDSLYFRRPTLFERELR